MGKNNVKHLYGKVRVGVHRLFTACLSYEDVLAIDPGWDARLFGNQLSKVMLDHFGDDYLGCLVHTRSKHILLLFKKMADASAVSKDWRSVLDLLTTPTE